MILLTDAVRLGLGYVLIQIDEHLSLERPSTKSRRYPIGSLVTCGSRYLSKAEFNYVMCEVDLLALQCACEKAKLYLLGAPFVAVTNHQPLVAIVITTPMPTLGSRESWQSSLGLTSPYIGCQANSKWLQILCQGPSSGALKIRKISLPAQYVLPKPTG